MELNAKTSERYLEVLNNDLDRVEFGKVLEGSTEQYAIRPTISVAVSGDAYVTYGIFNTKTGVMEADTRQIEAARQWALSLTAMAVGDALPENNILPMAAFNEEEEAEDDDDNPQGDLPLH